MIRRFLGAVQFLTVFPILGRTTAPGKAAVFFPLIGAILGCVAGALFLALQRLFDSSIAGLVAVAALIGMTGALHEDGLADCADALRAGRSREKMMAILKDSRIGTYGAVALIVFVALRWQAIMRLTGNVMLDLTASLALSRSAIVLMAFCTPAAGEELGAAFTSLLSRRTVAAIAAQALLFALLCGRRGALILPASVITFVLARSYFLRRLGGVNGDCLGATCQMVETVNLLVLAWRHSS